MIRKNRSILYQQVRVDPQYRQKRGTYEGYEFRANRFLLVFHLPSKGTKDLLYEVTCDPIAKQIFHKCQGHGVNECWHREFVRQWLKRKRNKDQVEVAIEAARMIIATGRNAQLEAAS